MEVRREVAKLFKDIRPEDLTVVDRGDGSAEYWVSDERRIALSTPDHPLPGILAVAHLYVASDVPPEKRRDDGAPMAVAIVYLSEWVKDIRLANGTKVIW